MNKINEVKYYEDEASSIITVYDPIHGQIEIKPPFSEIVKTAEMRRLKKITQTGFSFIDYPGLKYEDRLSHSIGAYYIMLRMLDKLSNLLDAKNIKLSEDEKNIALSAMLLHDIGHGPFSHSFEAISNYSHEKRTTDILLGKTEVNKVLVKAFGKANTRKIASFIAEIDEASEKSSEYKSTTFSRLIKSLISHQIDADRLDYLVRDAYYAGIETSINVDKIIDSIDIIMNVNGEYEVIVDRKNLTLIETPLIERFQHYRDIYFTISSITGDVLFKSIIGMLKEANESYLDNMLPKNFAKLVREPQNLKLDEFLSLTDENVLECFTYISKHTENPVLKEMCMFDTCLSNYKVIEDVFVADELKEKLKHLLNLDDAMQTENSIKEIYSKTKFYKKDEGFKIKSHMKVVDLTDVTNLVNARDYVEVKCTIFNPILFFLENNLKEKITASYSEYLARADEAAFEIQRKEEEFELKYLLFDRAQTAFFIEKKLQEAGFELTRERSVENYDKYFDTKDLKLFSEGKTLRIRKVGKNYEGTFKAPLSDGDVYTSRTEIEETLSSDNFEEFKEKLLKRGVDIDFDMVKKDAIMTIVTQRMEFLLSKNGSEVCFSIDDVKYLIGRRTSEEVMIEIEAVRDASDRYLLYEINDFITKMADEENIKIAVINESKYSRGMKKLYIEDPKRSQNKA